MTLLGKKRGHGSTLGLPELIVVQGHCRILIVGNINSEFIHNKYYSFFLPLIAPNAHPKTIA